MWAQHRTEKQDCKTTADQQSAGQTMVSTFQKLCRSAITYFFLSYSFCYWSWCGTQNTIGKHCHWAAPPESYFLLVRISYLKIFSSTSFLLIKGNYQRDPNSDTEILTDLESDRSITPNLIFIPTEFISGMKQQKWLTGSFTSERSGSCHPHTLIKCRHLCDRYNVTRGAWQHLPGKF